MKLREKAASPPRQARASGLVSKGFPLALASRGGLAGTEFRLTSWHLDASPYPHISLKSGSQSAGDASTSVFIVRS